MSGDAKAAARRPEGARGLPGRVNGAPGSLRRMNPPVSPAVAPAGLDHRARTWPARAHEGAELLGRVGRRLGQQRGRRGPSGRAMPAHRRRPGSAAACVSAGRCGRARTGRTRCRCRSPPSRDRARSRRSSAPRAWRWSAARWSPPAPCSLPALMLAEAVARLSKLRSTWPDSSASCAGGAAGVGDVHHEHAGLGLEHLAGQMPGAAVAAGAVVQRAGVGLRIGDQVGAPWRCLSLCAVSTFITSTLGTCATSVIGVKSRSGS